jgi:hypothetical protein
LRGRKSGAEKGLKRGSGSVQNLEFSGGSRNLCLFGDSPPNLEVGFMRLGEEFQEWNVFVVVCRTAPFSFVDGFHGLHSTIVEDISSDNN